jgi:DUF1009 family protein
MIGLVLGDTHIGDVIIKKLNKLGKKFIIIDISKNKIFKRKKKSFPLSIGQLGKCISILKKHNCKEVIICWKGRETKFYKN